MAVIPEIVLTVVPILARDSDLTIIFLALVLNKTDSVALTNPDPLVVSSNSAPITISSVQFVFRTAGRHLVPLISAIPDPLLNTAPRDPLIERVIRKPTLLIVTDKVLRTTAFPQ
jgi:hypothetical protein